jgi:hypothetical protein
MGTTHFFSDRFIYTALQEIGRDNGSDGDIGPYDDDGTQGGTCRPLVYS